MRQSHFSNNFEACKWVQIYLYFMLFLLYFMTSHMTLSSGSITIKLFQNTSGGSPKRFGRKQRTPSSSGTTALSTTNSNQSREFISSIFKERVLRDFWAITQREEAFLMARRASASSSEEEEQNSRAAAAAVRRQNFVLHIFSCK